MKKKIITLALAVVMCLSVITSVTAADTLNRVASTIPGTDIEYNYVENVTVQIPGTDVTFELEGVADSVGVIQGDIPKYIFAFYESGRVIFKYDLEVALSSQGFDEFGNGVWGDGVGASYKVGDDWRFEKSERKITRDAGDSVFSAEVLTAWINNKSGEIVAIVDFCGINGDVTLCMSCIKTISKKSTFHY